MQSVNNRRKRVAKQKLSASTSKKSRTSRKRVLGFNSSKQIDAEWYYSLAEVETVVAAVLAELDTDPGAGITLAQSETGITLNVVSTEGDEYAVDVELTPEGDEIPGAAEGTDVEDE